MYYVECTSFFLHFLLFLMFSLIFMNMQIRSFLYHTIGLKGNVSLLFGHMFGSLE